MSTTEGTARTAGFALLIAVLLAAPLASAGPAPLADPGADEPRLDPATDAPGGPAVGLTDDGVCWYVIFDYEVGPLYVDVTHCDLEVQYGDTTIIP